MIKKLMILCISILFFTSCSSDNKSSIYYVHEKYKKSIITPATENNYVLVVNDTVKHEVRLVKCLNASNNKITEDYVIFNY